VVPGVDRRSGRQLALVRQPPQRAGQQLEERVVYGACQRGEEIPVRRQLDVDVGLRRVRQRAAELGQVVVGTPLGRQRGTGRLQQLPHLHEVRAAHGGARAQHLHGGGQRVAQLLGAQLGDEAAARHPAGGDDEMLTGQQPQRLTDRAAAEPEPDAQLRLGRQALAGSQQAGDDLAAQIVGERLVGRRAHGMVLAQVGRLVVGGAAGCAHGWPA
jgi:hypothetical protein